MKRKYVPKTFMMVSMVCVKIFQCCKGKVIPQNNKILRDHFIAILHLDV